MIAQASSSPADDLQNIQSLLDTLESIASTDADSWEVDDLLEALTQLCGVRAETLPAKFRWRPRPDQPDRYDQQTAFINCKTRGVIWLLGGNGAGTTESTMAKVARFVLNTPAPRPDTPFWIIAGTFEQCQETCWKEKLYGHGHFTDEDVDWDRVVWESSKLQLPRRVPLKPNRFQDREDLWDGFFSAASPYVPFNPNGNWCLEFKSWQQGAHQMMARSIGGFAFVEQFPWAIFTEVLRGCREYNLPGSKLVEYTPVNPDLSGDIETMIVNGKKPKDPAQVRPSIQYLPDDWEVFHANTECAMEAGHVSREWFNEYFGMIPEDSRDMRMKGLFASFEGLIYKTFNPLVHVIGDEMFDAIADGCSFRRAIDWGAGPQNPFGCLWGARNRLNQWYIFDEYYSNDQSKTPVDHILEVISRHPWPNEPWYGLTYVDPSGSGNIKIASQIHRYAPAEHKNASISMALARNSVIEGIEHVKWLMKRSVPKFSPEIEDTIFEPRLFIHYSCVNLIRELKKYRWIKGKEAGTSDNPTNPRPEPLKFDDHLCDALRYLTFSDDSMHGLTIETMKTASKAASAVPRTGQNWRDAISDFGKASTGSRFNRRRE